MMRSAAKTNSLRRIAVALSLLVVSSVVAAGGSAEAARRVHEKTVNLDIARRVQAILAGHGIPVVMTRTSDRTVSLGARTALANARQADVFVSLHNNGSSNRRAGGTQVYHQIRGRPSRVLGEAIRRELARSPGLPSTLHSRRGDHGDYYFVLRTTRMPAVIVEGAFVTNPREARLLARASFRHAIAASVARGILAYQRTLTAAPLPSSLATPTRIEVPGLPAPGSLAGAAVNARTVALSWQAASAAIAYHVYRDGALIGTVGTPSVALLGGDAERISFTDEWAAPGQRYTYEIAAALRAERASFESAAARISVRTPPILVALDPGHGGRDPGATGSYSG